MIAHARIGLLASLLVSAACRSEPRRSAGEAPAIGSPQAGGAPTLAEIRGWWLVEGGNPIGDPSAETTVAYWFDDDALRVLFSARHERHLVAAAAADDGALRVDLGGRALLLTRREGGLILRVGSGGRRLEIRRATDEEAKDLERRDAKLAIADGRDCERALACCHAARAKDLATDDDCKALSSVPEVGRCTRAIALFAQKARGAGSALPECVVAGATHPR
jgi:hypothetical protein